MICDGFLFVFYPRCVSTFSALSAYASAPQERGKKKKLSAITKLTVTAFKDTKWRKNFINFQIDRVKAGEMPQGLIKRRDLDV